MTPSAALIQVLIQTWTILVDAYRELASRRLFWITMAISGFVAVAFAAVGLTPTGISILHWNLDAPVNSSVMSVEAFYKTLFVGLGVKVWLAWAASILALVSTASIFPDFLSGGSIDLWVSKPISRLRVFLTKYAAGLLFVALQVAVFTSASFLVLGLRAGLWLPGIFLAVPLVVCFFSYLFAFCVLFAVLTRSTIASLLLTILVWFGLFLVNGAEAALQQMATIPKMQIEAAERGIKAQQERPTPNEQSIRDLRAQIEKARPSLDSLLWWHGWALRIKSVLPKTDETIDLLERRLIALAELPKIDEFEAEGSAPALPIGSGEPVSQSELSRRVIEDRRARSATWILGTSLLFEAFVVGLAAFLFWRRDF